MRKIRAENIPAAASSAGVTAGILRLQILPRAQHPRSRLVAARLWLHLRRLNLRDVARFWSADAGRDADATVADY